MNKSHFAGIMLAATLALGITLRPGATSNAKSTDAGLQVFAALDRSESAKPILGNSIHALVEIVTNDLKPSDTLLCFRIESESIEWFSGYPDDPEDFEEIAFASMEKTPTTKGTLPGVFFQKLAQTLADNPEDNRDVVIAFWTDGENNDFDANGRKRFNQAVQAIASDPRVKLVAIAGVNSEQREEIRARFKPLGDRLMVTGPQERSHEKIGERIGQLRQLRPAESPN